MWAAIIAAVAAVVVAVVNSAAQSHASKTNVSNQQAMQEDAQAHDVEMSELAQQYHVQNLLNDPSLQLQGLKSAGVSDAAAVQALTGSSTYSWNPSVGSSAGQGSVAGQLAPSFSGITDALNDFFSNQNTQADTAVKSQEIVFSQQMCEESKARINDLAKRQGYTERQIDISNKIADSMVGLNKSQVDLNLQQLDQQSQKFIKEIGIMDAQMAAYYARASLDKANIGLVQEQINTELYKQSNLTADTNLKYANASVANSQVALNEANISYTESLTLNQDIKNAFDNFRLEVSKYLKCDVTSDLATMVVEASAAGEWESIDKILVASLSEDHGVTGVITKGMLGSTMQNHNKSKHYNPYYHPYYNQPFQPTWLPIGH